MARIAIVEDDASARRLLRVLLEHKGHEVEAFQHGLEALATIDDSFDLVLADLQLPGMDGIALCSALRKTWDKIELPVIIVSVHNEEPAIVEALEAGANDYIAKPYPPNLLNAKVSVHLLEHIRGAKTRRSPPTTSVFSAELHVPRSYPARLGHYVLERVLGQGAYGVVYEARTSAEGPTVALKVLDRAVTGDRKHLSRYLREVSTLSSLDCETIAKFVAAGYEAGRYYLAMENVKGRSASDHLLSEGALSLEQLLRVGADVSEALVAIHGQGLVHRDVKPGNILLCENGRAKLVDFGLAKPTQGSDVTSSSELLGTVGYLAPEVICGGEADRGSDLYALGISLHELCTGERVFVARSPLDVLRRVAEGWTAPPLSSEVPGIPTAVSDLVSHLTRVNRDERLLDPQICKRRFDELLDQTVAPALGLT